KHKASLKGFDVVQFINENSFGVIPSVEKEIISYLKNNNEKLFLLSCGTDYSSVNYAMNDHLRYSIFEGYKDHSIPKEKYKFPLRYTTQPYKELHDYMFSTVDGVIASDMDYHLPLKGHQKYLGLIPNPINIDILPIIDNPIGKKINIFIGINKGNSHTKGIRYFKEALDKIKIKYADKIEVEIVENLPYKEYITKYNKAHILLDQVLSYDQGYNALEAMAKGKVVFTGAEKEFETFYQLDKKVAINAVPDVDHIVAQLEEFILHPQKLNEIGTNARQFIEEEHDYKKIALKYIEYWSKA
ncbi:MAG: glycosyltransferase, partial [Flavobacteriaceae bacterium]|nr:glycosyltransferase [Flavobacteriaceae bacterium]